MMSNSFIYLAVNKISKKKYVGQTIRGHKRWQQHLMPSARVTRFKSAIDKYGKDAFVFVVLEYCPPAMLTERENFWINLLRPEYNVIQVNQDGQNIHSAETRSKMSAALKGKKKPEGFGAKIAEANRRRWSDPKARERQSELGRNRTLTEEAKRHLSIINTGKKHTDESRAKMSASRKGKKRSAEFCARNSEIHKGKVLSEATKQKLRIKALERAAAKREATNVK